MRDSQGCEQRHASHKKCASQHTGPVVLLALPFAAVKKLAQKSKEPSSADVGPHVATAMSFDRCIQNMTFGFATMLSLQAKS